MGSVEDDFGNLYADLDDQVNAGIATVQQSNSANEFDSMSEDDGADERVCEVDKRPTGCDAAEDLVLEAEDSESEDDLHIVLNEEGYSNFSTSEKGSGGMGVEWCHEEEEEEDEDLVIVTGSDKYQKFDQKRIERLFKADGLVQGSAERGSVSNVASNGWCVGSQIAGFPNKSVTSMSGRGDWDRLMISRPGDCASSNLCISPTGCNFSLPRKRTIFDINIEAFEQKPWRQQGVDITDYFNFDLNEESWKSYCQSLDQFRHQAKISTLFSFNESSRKSQMSSEVNKASGSGQCVNGGVSSTMLDKGLRRLEMRKGRAIQVEHGIGERIPSMDIRRPRQRDSDVVIQVTMEDSMEGGPAEKSGHSEKQDIDCSGSNDNEIDEGMLCLDLDGQACPVILSSPEPPETNYKGTAEAVITNVYYKKDNTEAPSSADASILKVASPSAIQANSNLSSSDSDRHSKASKDLEKIHSFMRKESLSLVTRVRRSSRSDWYFSNGSKSNDTKSMEKDWKYENDGLCHSPEDYRDRNRNRVDNMVELISPSSCKEASVLSYRRSQDDVDTFGVGRKIWEGEYHNGLGVGENMSFDNKTKRSRSYKIRRYAERHFGGKSSTIISHRKENHGVRDKRNLVEKDCSHIKRVASEDNGANSEDFHLYEQYHDDRGRRSEAHEDFDESNLKFDTFFFEEDPCLGHLKRKLDRHHIRIKDGHDGNAIQHREQNLLVMQRRRATRFGTEGENFKHKPGRHAAGSGRELRNSKRREKNDASPCRDMNVSNWYIEHDSTPDQRGRHGAHSPRDIFALSLRSSEQHVDQERSRAVGEKQFSNKKYGNRYPNSNYQCQSSFKYDVGLFRNEYSMHERDSYLDVNMERAGFNALTKPRLCANDEVWLRHQEQVLMYTDEGSLNCLKNSRNERSHANRNGRTKIAEEFAAPESRKDSRFDLDNYDKRRHDLGTLERREAVNLHLNGVKRKFLRQGNLDTTEMQSNAERQREKNAKSSRLKKGVCRQEVASHLRRQQLVSLNPIRDFKNKNPDEQASKKCENAKPIPQDHEDDEIEEGQLIEEPDDQVVGLLTKEQVPKKRIEYSKNCVSARLEEKNIQSKESTTNSNTFGGYDDRHILETLAKMEKRRERFREPIVPKQVEKSLKLHVDVSAVTVEVKQQRPARKRRWGASGHTNARQSEPL